jgi:hypothetical protein
MLVDVVADTLRGLLWVLLPAVLPRRVETSFRPPALGYGMTRVCLVGNECVNLRYELVSRETAREALATYDLSEPYENTVALETISLGAAVSLLNDLNWYLVRYADAAWVLEPSVSDSEWLSRSLATAIRDDEVDPAESGRYLRMYGVLEEEETRRLVEPMFVARTGRSLPEYDLRDVEDTVLVRVTEEEFGA